MPNTTRAVHRFSRLHSNEVLFAAITILFSQATSAASQQHDYEHYAETAGLCGFTADYWTCEREVMAANSSAYATDLAREICATCYERAFNPYRPGVWIEAIYNGQCETANREDLAQKPRDEVARCISGRNAEPTLDASTQATTRSGPSCQDQRSDLERRRESLLAMQAEYNRLLERWQADEAEHIAVCE